MSLQNFHHETLNSFFADSKILTNLHIMIGKKVLYTLLVALTVWLTGCIGEKEEPEWYLRIFYAEDGLITKSLYPVE